jgi:hypothetical protein
VARSVNVVSRFDVRVNNQLIQQVDIPPVSSGFYDQYANQVQQEASFLLFQPSIQVNYTYVPGGFNAQGWLNFFELHSRSNLVLNNGAFLHFRDWNSVGNNACEFVIGNSGSNTQVWDITDPLSPVKMQGNISGSTLRFVNDGSRLREYISFNEVNALIPVNKGRVPNQDMHNIQPADYLIITHASLLSQAERLANFHRQKNNLRVLVVTTEQVFNEFASGVPDPTAIRDFAKMYYDKTAGNIANRPKYLLLFGDATFLRG